MITFKFSLRLSKLLGSIELILSASKLKSYPVVLETIDFIKYFKSKMGMIVIEITNRKIEINNINKEGL